MTHNKRGRGQLNFSPQRSAQRPDGLPRGLHLPEGSGSPEALIILFVDIGHFLIHCLLTLHLLCETMLLSKDKELPPGLPYYYNKGVYIMNMEEYTKLQKVIEMSSAQGGYFVSINGMNYDTDFVRLEADDNGEIFVLMLNTDNDLIEIANINHWNIDTVQVRNYAIDNGDNGLVYQYNLEAVLDKRDQKSLEHWKGVLAEC